MKLNSTFNIHSIGGLYVSGSIPCYIRKAIQMKIEHDELIAELSIVMGSKEKAIQYYDEVFAEAIQTPFCNSTYCRGKILEKIQSIKDGE